MRLITSILVAALMLAGCAASGPRYVDKSFIEPGKAVVFFYRPNRFFQGGGGPDVYVNDVKEFRMLNGGYSYLLLNPGKHVVSPRNHFNWGLDGVDTEISVEAGGEYYLRMDFSGATVDSVVVGSVGVGSVSGTTIFNLVDETTAKSEIIHTRMVK